MRVYNKHAEKAIIVAKEDVISGGTDVEGRIYIDPSQTVDLKPEVAKRIAKGYPEVLVLLGDEPRPRKKVEKKEAAAEGISKE